jgi:uncharacterized membrane protein YagU involved in acid resistance
MPGTNPRPFAAILVGGLLAGNGDIAQAFVFFGILGATPYRILQGIAAGIYGARAAQMGWKSAALGLLLHFTIATTAAAVFWFASRGLPQLVARPFVYGLLFGELVFLFMYFVVLPLSARGPAHFGWATYVTGPIGHPLLVGLPIALCARRYSK